MPYSDAEMPLWLSGTFQIISHTQHLSSFSLTGWMNSGTVEQTAQMIIASYTSVPKDHGMAVFAI